ncbi:FAD-dependent monooxygenase [Saccharopolyspora sp. 5N102]|uniref:FAD-dependent monooxygenase n=1 Tax=Saccharopolyspora sp. 5N102 TaxID=3375155 RepID=UPI0037AA2F0B
MNTEVDFEVAVVGGGPVGMLLAAELALQNVRAVVLERLPEPDKRSKAYGVHARTAQLLDRRGMLEEVGGYRGARLARRPPRKRVPFHFAGMFELDMSKLPTLDGPALLNVPQAWSQAVFAERATGLGAEIRCGHEVTALTDHGDHVALTVEGPDGPRELTASYVVGTDGAHSVVRRLAGIPFIGAGPTVAALMGDVKLPAPEAFPAGWHRTPRGWIILIANPHGYSRVFSYDFRGPHPYADRNAPVTLEEFSRSVEYIAGRPIPMEEPRSLSRFGNTTKQAETYRNGRVFVAGDAAHVHFPFGGQGLNTGMQDVLNLGWKLAARLHSQASDSLLDTYHSERHPVAERVLWNVQAQVALMNPDPSVTPLRELFGELMHLDQVNEYLGGMLSGLDITHDVGLPDVPLAGRFAPDLTLKNADDGELHLVELLQHGRPILLDLADRADLRAAARPWADRVDTITAIPGTDLGTDALLVRPDGYIAWAPADDAHDPATLRQALTRWFGLPT